MGFRNTYFIHYIKGVTGLNPLGETVLEALGDFADDNTGVTKINQNLTRENKLGSHIYCSITTLALKINRDRSSVSKAVKTLKELDYIREVPRDDYNSSGKEKTMFEINMSKCMRLYICKKTLLYYGINTKNAEGNTAEERESNKQRNLQLERLIAAAAISQEDDYDDPWITKLNFPLPDVNIVYGLEELPNLSDKDLEDYWRNYRSSNKDIGKEKSSSNDGNIATTQNKTTTKEHKNKALSSTDDSTSDDNDANQYSDDNYEDKEEEYPYSGEELKLIRPDITAKEMRRFKSNTHSIKGYYYYKEEKHPIRINQDTVDDDGLMKPERIHIADPQKAEKFWSSNMGQKTLKRLETINRNYRKEMHYVVYKRYHPDDVLEE